MDKKLIKCKCGHVGDKHIGGLQPWCLANNQDEYGVKIGCGCKRFIPKKEEKEEGLFNLTPEEVDKTANLRHCRECGGWYTSHWMTKNPPMPWYNWKKCDCGVGHKQAQ